MSKPNRDKVTPSHFWFDNENFDYLCQLNSQKWGSPDGRTKPGLTKVINRIIREHREAFERKPSVTSRPQ